MTENKRIALNIVATYLRSLYALVVGLFTARWVLEALGSVNYGLYGVIGGLMLFIAMFNWILATAIGRYFAVCAGKLRSASDKVAALEESRAWFNVAVVVHTIIPVCLIAVGYPIGEWLVRNWLEIPRESVENCVWVFRFVCLSGLVGMINVPFNAMYTAKQYIAELTVYSFITTTLNFAFVYYMVSHPGEWLVMYALWMCILVIMPQIIICIRAFWVFEECRLIRHYWFDAKRYRQLLGYVGWQSIGSITWSIRNNGMTIFINKVFGPSVNAAQTIALSVSQHAGTLTGSFMTSLSPAIMTAYGAGDRRGACKMAALANRLCIVFMLVFLIPLAVELREVLVLWLKNPPPYAHGLCWFSMLVCVVDVSTYGQKILVNAEGRIAQYMMCLGPISLATIGVAYVLFLFGSGVYLSVGGALLLSIVLNSLGRVYFARKLVKMSAREWLLKTIVPCLLVGGISFSVAYFLRLIMTVGFVRLIVSTILAELVFLPLTWWLIFGKEERDFVSVRIRKFIGGAVR